MNVLVIGINHRTAAISLLEQAAAGTSDASNVLRSALACSDVTEAVVLSTCHRVEIYAAVTTFHGALSELGAVLASHVGTSLPDIAEHLYAYYADEAVSHTMRVASGLDSLVVGEPQILGQLRAAYTKAVQSDAAGTLLHELIQRALRAGKKVHATTDIDRRAPSVVSAALELAWPALQPTCGEWSEVDAVVIGAGSIAGVATAALRRAGVTRITVVNRTFNRAQQLVESAAQVGQGARFSARPWSALPELLATSDLAICGTGAQEPVLTLEHFAPPLSRPLVVCDVALPRDTDRAVDELSGVTVIDMEQLTRALATQDERTAAADLGDQRDQATPSLSSPSTNADVDAAERIVAEEAAEFIAWQQAMGVAPTVAALRARAQTIVAGEFAALDGRLPALTAEERSEVERTVHRIVNKLLHAPTVRMKELAATPGGDRYADVMRELFSLDEGASDADSSNSTATVPPAGQQVPGLGVIGSQVVAALEANS